MAGVMSMLIVVRGAVVANVNHQLDTTLNYLGRESQQGIIYIGLACGHFWVGLLQLHQLLLQRILVQSPPPPK